MTIFLPPQRRFAEQISELVYCNPFEPERIDQERAILAADFDEREADWNTDPEKLEDHPNVQRLCSRAGELLDAIAEKLAGGEPRPREDEIELLEDLVLWVLYHRYRSAFDEVVARGAGKQGPALRMYEAFAADVGRYLPPSAGGTMRGQLPHVFAIFFQVRRAFHNIFHYIYGRSRPAVRLRAAVWESIFTCDSRRYRRILFDRMHDYTTLIVGPSGTGKELVARAVGLSRYVPFDPETLRFKADFAGTFHSLNLSAMSPTLIESELFGHKRGAYTGAVADRSGWLEECPPMGTVFLDEVGEIAPAIQVKLLRVLEYREFQRLGETVTRRFDGKIIAATNRDIEAAIRSGELRADFYYRLCSDIIETPALAQRVEDDPEELGQLVRILAARIVGDREEAAGVAGEVQEWIAANLEPGYRWPGNVRELEQCVRNVLIRRGYRPARAAASPGLDGITAAFAAGELSAEEMLQRYCTLVYARTGSYEGAGRRLGLDRRTVKAKVDERLLAELRRGA